MDVFGKKGKNANLNESIGLTNLGNQFWNLSPSELIEDTIINGQGITPLNDETKGDRRIR